MNPREPLLTVAGITAFVTALLALLVAFGVQMTPDQQTAVLGIAAVLAPIVVGIAARPKVTPAEPPRDPNLRR